MKYKGPRIPKTILRKDKVGGPMLPDFETHYHCMHMDNDFWQSKGNSVGERIVSTTNGTRTGHLQGRHWT